MIIKCLQCGKDRNIKSVPRHASLKYYLKTNPICITCGHKKRIQTLNGHSGNWKNGRHIDYAGYVRIWDSENKKYIKEHHKVWTESYGKFSENEIIHHKDGNKLNNDISNLECLTKKDHDKMNTSLLKNHYNRRLKKLENLCEV